MLRAPSRKVLSVLPPVWVRVLRTCPEPVDEGGPGGCSERWMLDRRPEVEEEPVWGTSQVSLLGDRKADVTEVGLGCENDEIAEET